jgi:serine/threonine-protein kinase
MEMLRDKYSFVSILGHGGSGTVYEVRNVQLGRLEALKVLNNSLSPEIADRFDKEARFSASLDHPSIVKVFDLGQSDGISWYSMQLVEGPSLSKMIDAEIRLDATNLARLAIPLLDALAYSHRHGIIHRDIKPANILLNADGLPCLADFGIAKAIDAVDVTQTGNMLGTPAYMAPEQAMGKRVDGRADQYSLAITLYKAIAGRLPFSSDEPMATLVQRIKEDAEPIDHFVPSFPAPLKTVLMKALSREREDRYTTIDEMQREMLSACEKCHIQWNQRLDNFDGMSIHRIPIGDADTMASESTLMVSTAAKKGGLGVGKWGLRRWVANFIFFVALAGLIAAMAHYFYSKGSYSEAKDEKQPKEDSPLSQTAQAALADANPKAKAPTPEAAKPKSPAEQKETKDTKPPARIRVSPPQPLASKSPDRYPPELAGQSVIVKVVVGENGEAMKCSVVTPSLSKELEKFVTDFVKKEYRWAPAIANDGLPIESAELRLLVIFGESE